MDKRVAGSDAVVVIEGKVPALRPRDYLLSMDPASPHFRPEPLRPRKSLSPVASILWIVLLASMVTGVSLAVAGVQDPYEALSAIGLDRDLKQGYTLRADTWAGDLPVDGSKRIEYTLLRGNDYRFYAYAVTKGAKISFHIQDRDGGIVEAHGWQKQKAGLSFAGADIVPTATGTYYLVVKVEQSTAERTEWSLVYAYK